MIRALTYIAISGIIAFVLGMPALAPKARAQESLTCQVVAIVDGDTWDCSSGIRIRGWGYDTPEGRQSYGREATLEALNLLYGQTLVCTRRGTNRDRIVAECWLPNRRSVASVMVRLGAGWDYKQYSRGKYASEEQAARTERKGLWAAEGAIPPWQWRAEHRNGR